MRGLRCFRTRAKRSAVLEARNDPSGSPPALNLALRLRNGGVCRRTQIRVRLSMRETAELESKLSDLRWRFSGMEEVTTSGRAVEETIPVPRHTEINENWRARS